MPELGPGVRSCFHGARSDHLSEKRESGAVLFDLADFACVTRGKEYTVLDHPLGKGASAPPARSAPTAFESSQIVGNLYDCPEVPVGPEGVPCRVVVATHPASDKKSPVGVTCAGVVYELFFTTLRPQAFTACDAVELYLHRGALEPALADEDIEQDPDRWCSHSAWGQECWQVVSQWVWNLRLELVHQLALKSQSALLTIHSQFLKRLLSAPDEFLTTL